MNVMRKPFVEKVVLSACATENNLVKAKKLLELLSGRKAQIIKAGPKRRIPELGVKPGMELGTRVTLRGDKALDILRRLLGAIDNKLKRKQIADNHFSFGIEEYIDIPDMEYVREIGVRGFNTSVVFARAGLRAQRKKIKRGRVPKKQHVTPDEIINYMEENFKTKFE